MAMTKPSATQVDRAKRVLMYEGCAGSSSEECAAAAWRVYEKLNARLAPLLGSAGVEALFVRSAKLVQAQYGFLAEVATPGGMRTLGAALQALDPAAATEVAAALFGTFLELMSTFIGERLTVLILRSAWPTIEDKSPTETQNE